jgi:tRNA G18 (ribose-2'-O)-methylase SpoU
MKTMGMRGYFGIGVEGISKEYNLGNLLRSAHAFGASFFFSIAPVENFRALRVSDTAGSTGHMPYYQYESLNAFELPKDCMLVGIEFIEDSVELPSFRHPVRAAYVLGPEMGNLSPALLERCDHVVKIPMKFCVNVGVAGALVMYDRMLSMGRFAERPVRAGGPVEVLQAPRYNNRKFTRKKKNI